MKNPFIWVTKPTEFILTVTLNRWLTVMTRSMFRVTRIIQGGLLRVNTESYWQYSFYLKRALVERKQGVTCQYTGRHCHLTSVSERRYRAYYIIIGYPRSCGLLLWFTTFYRQSDIWNNLLADIKDYLWTIYWWKIIVKNLSMWYRCTLMVNL